MFDFITKKLKNNKGGEYREIFKKDIIGFTKYIEQSDKKEKLYLLHNLHNNFCYFCVPDMQKFEIFLKILINNGVDINSYYYSITEKRYIHLLNNVLLLSNVLLHPELKIMEILIQNGIDINSKNKYENGDTILISNLKYIHQPIINIKCLILYGANINEQNNRGDTALIRVIEYAMPESVKTLLDNGADVYIRNYSGKTAFMVLFNKLKNKKQYMDEFVLNFIKCSNLLQIYYDY